MTWFEAIFILLAFQGQLTSIYFQNKAFWPSNAIQTLTMWRMTSRAIILEQLDENAHSDCFIVNMYSKVNTSHNPSAPKIHINNGFKLRSHLQRLYASDATFGLSKAFAYLHLENSWNAWSYFSCMLDILLNISFYKKLYIFWCLWLAL